MNLRQKFERATKNGMGCEGGDPSSDIWLCAIEHGEPYEGESELRAAIDNNLHPRNLETVHNVWTGMVEHKHGSKFASLVAAIKGISIARYEGVHFTKYKYMGEAGGEEACKELGPIFKLNLYPLAFPRGRLFRERMGTA